jgi:cytidylate kinase
LARRYGCELIEIGVLVRVLAWWVSINGISIADAVAQMTRLDRRGELEWERAADRFAMAAIEVKLSGRRLSVERLGPLIGSDVAAVSTSEIGMSWIHALVRDHVRGRNAAISGRDVAAHTVPEAPLVIRLYADSSVRRRRKLEQLVTTHQPPIWSDDDALLPAPLPQAVHLDTTRLGPEAVSEQAARLIETHLSWLKLSDP